MNKIFRVVWNQSMGLWQCVSELVSAQGKAKNDRRQRSHTSVSTTSGAVVLKPKHAWRPIAIALALALSSGMANARDITVDTTYDTSNPPPVDAGNVLIYGTANPTVTVKEAVTWNIDNDFSVAYLDKSALLITEGSKVNAHAGYIGRFAGSEGTVEVSGVDSQWAVGNYLLIGNQGTGTLNITDGGQVTTVDGTIGNVSGSIGTVEVSGTESLWAVSQNLRVGQEGTGTLAIKNGAQVTTSNEAVIGFSSGSEGTVEVSGTDSHWESSDYLTIGYMGTGKLSITDGGQVTTGISANIGDSSDGVGTVDVNGKGSQWVVGDYLFIGSAAKGTLNITDGGQVKTGTQGSIGDFSGGEGIVEVSGTDSQWESGDYLTIGGQGTGKLSITDGGQVTTDMIADIGISSGGVGTVELSGKDSQWTVGERLAIGTEGKGTLSIKDGALLNTASITRDLNSQGSNIYLDGGTIQLSANNDFLFEFFTDQQTIALQGKGGTFDTQGFNVGVASGAKISGAGQFKKTGTGRLTVPIDAKQWSGGTHIQQGVLSFVGDYTMSDGEALIIGVNNMSEYGRLEVTGDVNLTQGALAVDALAAQASLSEGILADVIRSGGARNGELREVTDNSTLFDFSADYSRDPSAVDLKLVAANTPVDPVDPVIPPKPTDACNTVTSCAIAAGNTSALEAAHVLDTVIQTATSSALAGELVGLNGQKAVSEALTETLPLLAGGGNRLVADAAEGVMRQVQARGHGMSAAGSVTEERIDTHSHVWGTVSGAWDKQNSRNVMTGYEADHGSVIVGADTAVTDKLRLGAALAYTHSDGDSRKTVANHSLKADTWQGVFYGDLALNQALTLDSQIGLGRASLKGKRHIGFADKTAKADYHATLAQAGLGLSYRLGDEQNHVTPFARVDYTHVSSSGYTETGAGALNLKVKRQNFDSLVWRAGVRAQQQVSDSLALVGSASVGLESMDRDNPITAEFTGAPGLAFSTPGNDYGRVVGQLSVGASYRPAKNVELIGRYGVNLRKGYTGQSASATVQVRW